MPGRPRPDEGGLELLRVIEVRLASRSDVATARPATGISDARDGTWRKRVGGLG